MSSRRSARCRGIRPFEVRIGNWLTTWAATNGFASTRDTAGNVIIEVPAPGKQGFFILKSKAVSTERAATNEPWYVPIE